MSLVYQEHINIRI